jgi:hypothetical protein
VKGFLGVDFFFVLSGFIILNAHADDPATGRALESYVFKRLNRIYVPYLPMRPRTLFRRSRQTQNRPRDHERPRRTAEAIGGAQ